MGRRRRAGQQRRHQPDPAHRAARGGGLGRDDGRQRQGRLPVLARRAAADDPRARAGTSSTSARSPPSGCVEAPVHYAASKSALRGFTEALAREVGRYDIKVNLLAPGLLDAGLGTLLPQHRIAEYVGQCALGRLGTADEVAALAVFLVSDDNTFMTGAKLVADGGL